MEAPTVTWPAVRRQRGPGRLCPQALVPPPPPRLDLSPLLLLLMLLLLGSSSSSAVAELSSTDPWCRGLLDGPHLDALALEPCSGMFWCQAQQLVRVKACPRGQGFTRGRDACVPLAETSCSSNESQRETLPARPGPRLDYLAGMRWEEVSALLKFKAANVDLGGSMATWTVPRTMNSSTTPSGRKPVPFGPFFMRWWAGVTLAPGTRRVSKLELNNPDGVQCLWRRPGVGQSIPPEIGDLASLEVLDLSRCGLCTFKPGSDDESPFGGLQGSIPAELSHLSHLSLLNLKYNRLEGSLREPLSALRRLQLLDVSHNRLSGPLEGTIDSLLSLTYLRFSHNNFSGGIPPGISRLQGLSALEVEATPLSGPLPEEIGEMLALDSILMKDNPLMRTQIPDSFSKLSNLTQLWFDNMPLSGSFPTWTTALQALESITITKCQLFGTIPSRIGGPGFNFLVLENNQLTGDVEGLGTSLCQGKTPGLKTLSLQGNRLTGAFPSTLIDCTYLTQLNLMNNSLRGPLPPFSVLSQLSRINSLHLAHNQLSGNVPNILKALSTVEVLDLSYNRLDGQAPPLACQSLGSYVYSQLMVSLAHNQLTGDIGALVAKPPLSCAGFAIQVDLSHNRLTGTLPQHLQSFSLLVTLKLAGNNITGTLAPLDSPGPSPPPFLLHLGQLDLSSNGLSGPIPESLLQQASALTLLDLSNNKLGGLVPGISFSKANYATGLQQLLLGGNRLSGAIPAGLSTLRQLTALDLSNNRLSQGVPTGLGKLPLLGTLNVSGNALQGSVPVALSGIGYLTSLDLSRNNLSGPIPWQLAGTSQPWLSVVDLSDNRLAGEIPYEFATVGRNLSLDFSRNNLSGQVPKGQYTFTAQGLEGNLGLCGGERDLTPWNMSCDPPPAPPAPVVYTTISTGAIVGIAAGCVAGLVLIGLMGWWLIRKEDEWEGGAMLEFMPGDVPLTARYLVDATGNFSEESTLGRGGFGSVYRAELPDGTVVAIKRLAAGSSQGDQEFKAEVQLLGSLSHRNLVQLVAAYIAKPPSTERLLVYVFMSGGGLDTLLSDKLTKDSPFTLWDVRLSVALDIARALRYLHHDCNPPIIHRDMKPANVLLDSNMTARVADFGLAKSGDLEKSHQTTEIFGTLGYLAPEYSTFGHLSQKTDVYAYGVTLLQIMTGKRPSDEDIADRGLARWVTKNSVNDVLDSRLVLSEEAKAEAMGILHLGVQCISRIPVDRPSMAEAVHILENISTLAAAAKDEDD